MLWKTESWVERIHLSDLATNAAGNTTGHFISGQSGFNRLVCLFKLRWRVKHVTHQGYGAYLFVFERKVWFWE